MAPGSLALLAPALALVAMLLQGCNEKDADEATTPAQLPIIDESSNAMGDLCAGMFDCESGFGGSMTIAFKAKWWNKVNPSAAMVHFGSTWPKDNLIIHDNYTDNSLTVSIFHPSILGPMSITCNDVVWADDRYHYYVWSVFTPGNSYGGQMTDTQTIWFDGEEKCTAKGAWPPRIIARNSLLVGESLTASGAARFDTGFVAELKVFTPAVAWDVAWPEYVANWWTWWKILLAIFFLVILVGAIITILWVVMRQCGKGNKNKDKRRRKNDDSSSSDRDKDEEVSERFIVTEQNQDLQMMQAE